MLKVEQLADMVRNVLTNQVDTIVYVQQAMVEIRTMVSAHRHIDDALLTANAVIMKNAYSPENAYAHHHISWTLQMAISVKALASVSHAE